MRSKKGVSKILFVKKNQGDGNAHDSDQWYIATKDDFTWSESREPHAVRRRQILEAYPEISQLFGPDLLSAAFCFSTVVFQFTMAYAVRDISLFWLCLLTYCVSGTLNHSLQLAMHELSHDLFFQCRWKNLVMSYIANLPTCVASACTFKRYHLEHHTGQGVDGYDVDIPTHWERRWMGSTFGKFMWVLLMPIFYSFRPMIIRPKSMIFTELCNWIVILISDLMVIKYFGMQSFFYLLFGSLWGMGLHPMTGHFISEHAEFIPNQETYSYYGPLNFFAYNVGYHNEHHDFPRIPGRLLPRVKEIAPEFYDLPHYTSWSRVVLDFIFTDQITQLNRVKRKAC